MTKAEEAALKAYPIHSVLIQPARRGGYYADGHLRDGFIKGYEQAEKDLALTWQDIRKICTLSVTVEVQLGREISDEQHYGEVLRRFNKTRDSYGN